MATTPQSDDAQVDEILDAEVVEVVYDNDADDAAAEDEQYDEYEGGEEDEEGEEEEEDYGAFSFFKVAPAWLISTLIHVLIILILGLITLARPQEIVNILTASNVEEGLEMEEFEIQEIDPGDVSEVEEITDPVEIPEQTEMVEQAVVETPMEIASVPIEMSDLASEMAPSAMTFSTLAATSSSAVGSRSADMKKKLLREYGGTKESETAVQLALKWLARHQVKGGPYAGAWTHAHHEVCGNSCGNGCVSKNRAKQVNSATALALLPFLGAGQTHTEGEYRTVVFRGLQFLMKNGKAGRVDGLPVIDYRGGGNMYDHGLATIALCEAYAMTGASEIAGPAQGAINYIITAQCRDGGWRYTPKDKSGGDTSVVGWQVMALKSGHMGHLAIPPATIQGSMLFLDRVQSQSGTVYGYNAPVNKVRGTTTAVGLLCRMYTGWDKTHPGIIGGVKHLEKIGVNKTSLYHNYYAAQVLRHYGGAPWEKFNGVLRDWLVETQDQQGEAKGSWFFEKNGHMAETGRLVTTSFATMILEVYYRHMPLYAKAAAEEEFPL